jgi:putative ABC transport system substrate-binding protein
MEGIAQGAPTHLKWVVIFRRRFSFPTIDQSVLAIIKWGFLIAVAIAVPQTAAQTSMPRIGWLSTDAGGGDPDQALEQGLRDFGLVDGRTVRIFHRSARGDTNRLGQLARELVKLDVVLILAPDPPSVTAASMATTTIPIVMRVSNDPVKSGLVKSLARPGGNVTGVYSDADELVRKRIEILKEAIPNLTRVAVLWDPNFERSKYWFAEARSAAAAIGVQVMSVEIHGSRPDFGAAINSALANKAQALIALRSPRIVGGIEDIASIATTSRLPAIFDDQRFAQAGGLMSYGADLRDIYRHLAAYADKILKGARPEDLPVEQPTKFELVINSKTAQTIHLTISKAVLLRADRVIE